MRPITTDSQQLTDILNVLKYMQSVAASFFLLGVVFDTTVTYSMFKALGAATFYSHEANKDFASFLVTGNLNFGVLVQFFLLIVVAVLPIVFSYLYLKSKNSLLLKAFAASIIIQLFIGAAKMFGGLTWIM